MPVPTKYDADLDGNVVALIEEQARAHPGRVALRLPALSEGAAPREQVIRYGELWDRVGRARCGLARAGLVTGDRVLLFVPVSIELYVLALALLASGMTVVLIDKGMGRKRAAQALRQVRARAVFAPAALLRWTPLLRPLWGLQRFAIGGSVLFARDAASVLDAERAQTPLVERRGDDEALITFTSGSTGAPKGADRCHGLLRAQHYAFAEAFPSRDGDVDMPCFPVLVLHNLASGITTVLPALDFAEPASVDASRVVGQLLSCGVTRLSGAPAYMERLCDFIEAHDRPVRGVRRVLVGGAPTRPELCGRVARAFPEADARVVYGSTEAEPMASVPMAEVAAEAAADDASGFLVGRPCVPAELALVELPETLPTGGVDLRACRVKEGAAGEVLVRGPHVIRRYLNAPATGDPRAVTDQDGRVWHRTGDVGHWDADGRLWLTGRTRDLVRREGRTLHPLILEARLDTLPGVRRAALLAHSRALDGELLLELEPAADRGACLDRVRECLAARSLEALSISVVERIPMDRRHQSKIDRPALRAERERRRRAA